LVKEIVVLPFTGVVDDLYSQILKTVDKGFRVLVTTLTKKMSEDLTAYLKDMNVKARYMHSGIDTMERMKIIQELRKGEADVLVGINLLREGLDIPEVALVAILDADKEGFLRSENALIQTIGRAARNSESKVIMYADHITGSMERAIGETNRRRVIQMAYNKKNGITPTTVKKDIRDIIEISAAPEEKSEYGSLEEAIKGSIESIGKTIKKYETEMNNASKDLQFERAGKIRDMIYKLQKEQKKQIRGGKN